VTQKYFSIHLQLLSSLHCSYNVEWQDACGFWIAKIKLHSGCGIFYYNISKCAWKGWGKPPKAQTRLRSNTEQVDCYTTMFGKSHAHARSTVHGGQRQMWTAARAAQETSWQKTTISLKHLSLATLLRNSSASCAVPPTLWVNENTTSIRKCITERRTCSCLKK
jgi:hypothetical protein